jgi:hypothetical protein
MTYKEIEIPEKVGYIIPIGDLHYGDKNFKKEGLEKLKGYLEWVKENPSSRIFLNGDIYNVASRISKTSPFESDVSEYDAVIDLFKPYANQIIGATDGNHESRVYEMFGFSPTQRLCERLNIQYCGYSALIRIKVGKREDDDTNRFLQNYYMYFHHTTGGGGTIGGKINRVIKLRDIVEGVDVYCGSHNHQLAVAPQDVFYPSAQGGKMKRRIWYVDCGSYLGWDESYAEKGMMPPTKLGSPRIRLASEKHDVHISL